MNVNIYLARHAVPCKYGAPMGRGSYADRTALPTQASVQRVQLVDGDYDRGGAYWGGAPALPLWCAMNDADTFRWFVRAKNRGDAVRQLCREFPGIGFAVGGPKFDFLAFDNGGETFDRYTVFYRERTRSGFFEWSDYLALSADPDSPQGISQCGETHNPYKETRERFGTALPFNQLPDNIRAHVYRRLWSTWN